MYLNLTCRLVCLSALIVLLVGCQANSDNSPQASIDAKSNTSNLTPVTSTGTDPEQQDPQESKSDSQEPKSTWAKVKRLYSTAKQKGTTTASDAKQWVSDMLGSASDSTSKASKDATKWAQDLYQHAVEQGETQTTNVKDWVMEDLSKGSAWEYKIVKIDDNPEATMNSLGRKRWECFDVEDGKMYFKRKPKSYLSKVPVKDLMRLIPLIGVGDQGGQ